MIGTAVLSLPWAFQQSGIMLGACIAFVSYLISFYTCKLIVQSINDDADYSDTLKKYFGKPGYYAGLIAPAILMGGAVVVLFVILSQLLYTIALAIFAWSSSTHPDQQNSPVWDHFSSSYTALFFFCVAIIVCSKKDISLFIKMGSFGAFFVSMLILYIMVTGIIGLTDTNYRTGTMAENDATVWADPDAVRTIILVNTNFSPLAGMLGCGYYLHTCAPNITRTARNPENNIRDLFMGYSLVFMTYVIVGGLGSIGFISSKFAPYYTGVESDPKMAGQINENCLNMFDYTNIPAFVLSLAIASCLFSTYPLINQFLKLIIKNLFWARQDVSKKAEVSLTLIFAVVPLLFALFYPNIGTLLSYVGAISGFILIYVLPVMVHLKQMRMRIQNPILAEAVAMNRFKVSKAIDKSPQIQVENRTRQLKNMLDESPSNMVQRSKAAQMRTWYWQCAFHSFIPVYGFMIMLS